MPPPSSKKWFEETSGRLDDYQHRVKEARHPQSPPRHPRAKPDKSPPRDYGRGLKYEDMPHDQRTKRLDDRLEHAVAGGFSPLRFVHFVLGRPIVVITRWNLARDMPLQCRLIVT
jgi:hypothetical protein